MGARWRPRRRVALGAQGEAGLREPAGRRRPRSRAVVRARSRALGARACDQGPIRRNGLPPSTARLLCDRARARPPRFDLSRSDPRDGARLPALRGVLQGQPGRAGHRRRRPVRRRRARGARAAALCAQRRRDHRPRSAKGQVLQAPGPGQPVRHFTSCGRARAARSRPGANAACLRERPSSASSTGPTARADRLRV